jgi:gliding motility-associated-like protein
VCTSKPLVTIILICLRVLTAFGQVSDITHTAFNVYTVGNIATVDGRRLSASLHVPAALPLPVVVTPPNITYPTPKVYKLNSPIAPLKPTNTGGDVPATIYGETVVFAGTGLHGANDGDGTQAQFTESYGLTTDAEGNIYLAAVQSNTIKMSYKQAPATPLVSIDLHGTVASCTGLELVFNAVSAGEGINPTYQWMLNGQQVNNPGKVYTSSTLTDGDKVTCMVINNDGCIPVASPVSEAANIVITPVQVSTVSIAASVSMPVCPGKEVTFTPTPANYQTTSGLPTYVWYVNGNQVGNKETYATNALANGDEVYCLMTTYGECVAPAAVQSNTVVVSLAQESACVVNPIVIPNTFTPNGDGHNDTWNIPSLVNYSDCIVSVFNRYGAKLFQSVGYTKPWNGTHNSNLIPSGAYYYVIDLKNGKPKLSGYVVVLK